MRRSAASRSRAALGDDVKTGSVRRRRALWRGGSESGWGASRRESDRIDGRRLTSPGDLRVAADSRGQVEANVRRRHERRRRRAPVAQLGAKEALAERDRLDLGLRPCTAIADSRACVSPRRTEQHELQGAVGQPRQEQVAGTLGHERLT